MGDDRVASMVELVDVRDSLNVVINIVACLALACQAPTLPQGERRALGAVITLARDKLDELSLVLADMGGAQQ